jgi:Putative Actinobacterial Holin-X, holin superfamily III
MAMSTPQMQRTVPELLGNMVDNIQQIIRSEFRLAKAELQEKASRASKPAITLGAGFLLGLYGFGFLLLAAAYALSMIMAAGLAALFVGGFLALVSIVLVTSSAKKLKALNPAPEKTIQTLRENVQWAKNQIK